MRIIVIRIKILVNRLEIVVERSSKLEDRYEEIIWNVI